MAELFFFESIAGLMLAFQTLVICEAAQAVYLYGWARSFKFNTWDDVVFGGFYLLIAAFLPITIWAMLEFAKTCRRDYHG